MSAASMFPRFGITRVVSPLNLILQLIMKLGLDKPSKLKQKAIKLKRYQGVVILSLM